MTARSSPGVHVTRRSVLELPLFAALLPPSSAPRPGRGRQEGRLSFADFSRRCAEVIEAADPELPEARLLQLAELAARLAPGDVPRPDLGAYGGYDPKVGFGPVHRASEFLLIEWRLDPHAVLPPHNHSPINVLSVCVEGECWVEHFEIVGDAPPPGEEGAFTLRQTHAQLLRPGRASSLTPERDNIHTFRAGPKGALGIDVNVVIPGKGSWSMIAHEPEGGDAFDRRYRARWIGKP